MNYDIQLRDGERMIISQEELDLFKELDADAFIVISIINNLRFL